MKTAKRKTGDEGEDVACTWLTAHGYKIIGRNVSNAYGEIDIIGKKANVIHYIEVKTRKNDRFGAGIEAVASHKLEKFLRCAQSIANTNFPNLPMCVDAISIDGDMIRFFENITL